MVVDGSIESSATVTNISAGVWRVSANRVGDATPYKNNGVVKYTGQNSDPLYFTGIQVEKGSTASEYQKIMADSNYHGAGVDGVKYFQTKKDGSPLDVNPYFLVENQSTNITNYSQIGRLALVGTNTDGSEEYRLGFSDKAIKVISHGTGYYALLCSLVSGETYNISYSIEVTSGIGVVRFSGHAANSAGDVSFNVSDGTIVSTGSSSITPTNIHITPISDSVVRASVIFVAEKTTTSTVAYVGLTNGPDAETNGWVGDLQVEQGEGSSSHIATSGTVVTRSADVLKYEYGAGNFPQEFCYFAEFEPLVDSTITSSGGNYRIFGTQDSLSNGEFRTFGHESLYAVASYDDTAALFTLSIGDLALDVKTKYAIQTKNLSQKVHKDGVLKLSKNHELTNAHSSTGTLEIANWSGAVMPMKVYSVKMLGDVSSVVGKALTKLGV